MCGQHSHPTFPQLVQEIAKRDIRSYSLEALFRFRSITAGASPGSGQAVVVVIVALARRLQVVSKAT